MRTSLATWLAASAALWPAVTAFYPYQYDDDSTPSSEGRRSTGVIEEEARSITLPLRRVPTSLRSRQNAYNIVNSKDPTQANSVAVDQDGSDLSYMVAVTIGDSKEEYHLLLDSAASNTWVMGQECQSDACGTHNTFGTGDSSSLQTQDTPFSVTYGTGSVSGTLATDTLHIGSLSTSVTFGLATNVSSEFKSYPMDGILGLGRGSTTDGSIGAPQLLDALKSVNLIPSKVYGIHLSRTSTSLGVGDGELNLGTPNPSRYTGSLNYLPCIPNPTGFWELALADAHINNTPVGLTGKTAIIDTGTSYILLPPPDALALHSTIPGFTQDGETFSVPCDTSARLAFAFGDTAYGVDSKDWVGGKLESGLCRSNVVGRQTFGEGQWLVGDVFLKNVYAVFDVEGARVGFGTPPVEEGGQSASASATGTTMVVGTATATATASGGGGAQQTAAVEGSPAASPSSVAESQGQGAAQSGADGLIQASLTIMVGSFAFSLFMFL